MSMNVESDLAYSSKIHYWSKPVKNHWETILKLSHTDIVENENLKNVGIEDKC